MQETNPNTQPEVEGEDSEKKKAEFEALLHEQSTIIIYPESFLLTSGAERENVKVRKQHNTEQNKDPKEMMLNIQKNFRDKFECKYIDLSYFLLKNKL